MTTGSCESCPQGAYRTQNVTDLCVPCPRGRTTRTPGASTSGQCDIGTYYVFLIVRYYLYKHE